MKKYISFLTIIAIIAIGCTEKRFVKENSDLRKDNIRGNAISVNLKRFEVDKKFGEIVKTDRMIYSINSHKAYHNDGLLKYKYFFGDKDVFYAINIYHYDSLNRIIDEVSKNGLGILTGKTIYEYSDSLINITKYDEKGKEEFVLKQKIHDSLVISESKWPFKNNEIQKFPEYVLEYAYDDNGRKIKESKLDILEYLKTGSKKYYYTEYFKYDVKGNLISIITSEYCREFIARNYSDSTVQKTETFYEYDDFNNVLHEKYLKSTPKSKTARSEKLDFFNEKEFKIEYQYKYDSQNNWISKIEIKNGKPRLLEERTILYGD